MISAFEVNSEFLSLENGNRQKPIFHYIVQKIRSNPKNNHIHFQTLATEIKILARWDQSMLYHSGFRKTAVEDQKSMIVLIGLELLI